MRRRGWLQLFSDLGEAILDVLRAELALLEAEWRRWGRHVQIVSLVLGAVAFLAFWTVPLVLLGVVLLVERWGGVSLLAAVWITVGAIVVVAAALALFARLRYLRALESPLEAARRRFRDHTGWWRTQLLPERSLAAGGDELAAPGRDEDDDDA